MSTVNVVDLFSGAGGFSEGVHRALGAPPMLVINHDEHAIQTHRLAHPASEHVQEDIYLASPYTYVRPGQRVLMVVASPSCTHHSRAAGGKPLSEQLRSHPWVIVEWAREHFPPVIIVENVTEMKTWGPLYDVPTVMELVKVGAPDLDYSVYEAWVATYGLESTEMLEAVNALAIALRLPKHVRVGRPIPERAGEFFERWMGAFDRLGYDGEAFEINAADYGAPTARHRLFVVFTHRKKHGRPPRRPTPTHGPGLLPYRTAGSIIDWTIPTCSLWATLEERRAYGKLVQERLEASGRYTDVPRCGTPKRPLAKATLRRIAAGVDRFVLRAAQPFVVSIDHRSSTPGAVLRGMHEPVSTVTTKNRHAVVQAGLINTRNGERRGQAPRVRDLADPFPTITAQGSQGAVAAASLVKFYGTSSAADPREPLGAITAQAGGGHHGLAMAFLAKHFGGGVNGHVTPGQDLRDPIGALTTTGQVGPVGLSLARQEMGRARQVYAFMTAYYGTSIGQALDEPCRTVTTHDRFGLVTVELDGEPWVITDIGMRMLQPHELADAMGFQRDFPLIGSKKQMIERIGNAVCPDAADALIRAQFDISPRWVVEPGVAK